MSAETKYRSKRKWVVGGELDENAVNAIKTSLGVSPALARLLYKRGCETPEAAGAFIRRETGSLHDPYLMPDIKKATAKIAEALSGHKKIVIYGDYDVDGVTSVSVLYLYLASLGADVGYYIPKRSNEGYGMSEGVVRRMIEDGAGLIITVDTGITAIEEIKLAKSLGCDVVVTDHHECREELPAADAVVNPQRHDSEYPFCELAGVGVVYKLVCALENELRTDGDLERAVMNVSNKYIDLVAIGTVADVMPVRDENRLIISYGLSRMEAERRTGLAALIESAAGNAQSSRTKTQRITSSYISYTIAPRINAAGRINDASVAVELFLTDDEERAHELAEKLCAVNRERQLLENVIAEEAYAKAEKTHDFSHDPVIILSDEKWHNGIIGIVASRVTEKFGCPSILISFEGCEGKPDDFGKGSGRSIRGLNLVEALGACEEYLEKYGGHELAAGLTVRRDKLDALKLAVNEAARKSLEASSEEPTLAADDVLSFGEVNLKLAEELLLLEPYGVGNPTPVYITNGLTVKNAIGVGSNKHTGLTLTDGYNTVMAMCFSVSPEELDVHAGDIVDVMYNLDVNEFRGERSAQMIIRAVRKSEEQQKLEDEEYSLYRKMLRGEPVPDGTDIASYIPSREDFAAVYRVMRHEISMKRTDVTARGAVALMNGMVNMNYIKLRLIFDIFSEMNILTVSENDRDRFNIGLSLSNTKVQLEKSNILRRIRSKYKYR